MVNSILSKNPFKRETVLEYALVNAFTEMEGNAQVSSMETNGTSITSKKSFKSGSNLQSAWTLNFRIKLRDYALSILKNYALSAYPTVAERVIQNTYSYAQGKGVSFQMCMYTLILSIFMLRQHVCLMVSCIILLKCDHTSIQIRYVSLILFIHFIYRRLQLLVQNILIKINKEIHSYH